MKRRLTLPSSSLPGKHEAISAILDGPEAQACQPEFDWLEQPGHHLLVWTDNDYPALLREIADPPVMLYVIGQRQALSNPQVAIVGSRNPSPMGRENAQAFAKSVAGAGLTVTSGGSSDNTGIFLADPQEILQVARKGQPLAGSIIKSAYLPQECLSA